MICLRGETGGLDVFPSHYKKKNAINLKLKKKLK